jgi:hypothetical protein
MFFIALSVKTTQRKNNATHYEGAKLNHYMRKATFCPYDD